ncbi:sn-glycerol-3-phosphate ABC transporter ATP-binding protein UgpC [Mesorhizobium sp. BAC0120]|uniref:ABC transporter ATP-binding protein n=1 Tax=Mesorhizobium sp. BAC0120 TaxID=3090670 RepID=UPI00298C693B|nr:sn-glycerol-3-phosphate ABC transporter ATP-binding protein UgpC [Mesorhizobium sp. BAC0120]MDW6022449.1 sn-glycerol-3-phosphate ABC transporter ATP-binding protein UgpC [Mesorhizobium sp. BAC0120]
MADLSLRALTKAYDGQQTVHGIDLEITAGEFVVLVGPSGCGKSTTLRMIAGLEAITSGEIRIADRVVNDLEPGDRDIAMVFQNYALFPHLTVADNITFGLKLRHTPKQEVSRRLEETAAMLQIEALLGRKPRQLSGGQRQRVAMARALIRRPRVFLFDEPLSNLDAKLRVQMRTEIKQLHARVATTTVYVTHDQVEAMTLADRVVVMNKGRIEQVASPQELYLSPATRFVAGFIGSPGMNFVPAAIEASPVGLSAKIGADHSLSIPDSRAGTFADSVGRTMMLGIRPEHLKLAVPGADSGRTISVVIKLVEPLGMETLVHFDLAAEPVVARLEPDSRLAAGHKIDLSVNLDALHLIDPETERVVRSADRVD